MDNFSKYAWYITEVSIVFLTEFDMSKTKQTSPPCLCWRSAQPYLTNALMIEVKGFVLNPPLAGNVIPSGV